MRIFAPKDTPAEAIETSEQGDRRAALPMLVLRQGRRSSPRAARRLS